MDSHPPVICYGEILWDLLPTGEVPGGAPMNVAYHLNKLGHSPAVITRIGRDERGNKLLSLLEGKKHFHCICSGRQNITYRYSIRHSQRTS